MPTTSDTVTATTATVTNAQGANSSGRLTSTASTSATRTTDLSTGANSRTNATPGAGTDAPGTPLATHIGYGDAFFQTPLPLCLNLENFIGSSDLRDQFEQFKTDAIISGSYSPAHDNQPDYFALRLRQKPVHFHITLSAVEPTDFNFIVDALSQSYTINLDILEATLKAARHQPNRDNSTFYATSALLCDLIIAPFPFK